MDEAEQQILHEYQHARAKLLHGEMDRSELPGASASPSRPSTANNPTDISPSPKQMPANEPRGVLHSSLLTGKFSDLTIVCGEQKWRAHKVIVSSQSLTLGVEIEALEDPAIVDLTAHDHEAVAYAMEYLYTANYVTTDTASGMSLAIHIKVFLLGISLGIAGLETLAASKYKHNLNQFVTDLEVYFWSVKRIYAHTTPAHPGLRVAATEAAVMELSKLLSEKVRRRFMQITSEIPDFQADIYMLLLLHPSRSLDIVQELCSECGPQGADDGYAVVVECKGCGKEKVMEFY